MIKIVLSFTIKCSVLLPYKAVLILILATKTAIAISSACGLNGSVESLIRKNFDYLMYHSIIKLKRNNSDALGVVTVLLKTIEIDTVNSVEEIVNNVNIFLNFYLMKKKNTFQL